MSWFWAWNFANTLSVNDVIFAKRLTDITPYTDYIEKLTAIFAPDELDDIDTLPESPFSESRKAHSVTVVAPKKERSKA